MTKNLTKNLTDIIDEKLLALLTNDARLSITLLAKELKLSRTAVQARIKRLERLNIIEGYTLRRTIETNYPLRALVLINIESKFQDKTVTLLQAYPQILSLHTLSGLYDLSAEVVAYTTNELDDLLTKIGKLPGITKTISSILLSKKFEKK